MAGYNPQALDYRALSGNQVAVMIGDSTVAFAQTVTHSFEMGAQSVYGVGSTLPQEIQQLRIQPQITITALALTQNGLAVAGQSGGIASVLGNNAFNFIIVDRDGNILFTYVGGVCQSFNENIPTNQLVTDTITFLCLDVYDDSGQSILNVGNAAGIPSASSGASNGGLGVNVRAGANGVSLNGSVNVGGVNISGGF